MASSHIAIMSTHLQPQFGASRSKSQWDLSLLKRMLKKSKLLLKLLIINTQYNHILSIKEVLLYVDRFEVKNSADNKGPLTW